MGDAGVAQQLGGFPVLTEQRKQQMFNADEIVVTLLRLDLGLGKAALQTLRHVHSTAAAL